MHDRSLFSLYSNVKAWVFVVNCFSQFIGRGFTNRSKSWIYLRNNVVHYHFSLRKLTAALNLCSVIKTHLNAHPRSSCFRGDTRKGKFFTRKVWSSILRQPKHWFVFSLEGPIEGLRAKRAYITYAERLSFAWNGILMSESFEGRFWRDANLSDYF